MLALLFEWLRACDVLTIRSVIFKDPSNRLKLRKEKKKKLQKKQKHTTAVWYVLLSCSCWIKNICTSSNTIWWTSLRRKFSINPHFEELSAWIFLDFTSVKIHIETKKKKKKESPVLFFCFCCALLTAFFLSSDGENDDEQLLCGLRNWNIALNPRVYDQCDIIPSSVFGHKTTAPTQEKYKSTWPPMQKYFEV